MSLETLAELSPAHFKWELKGKVGIITLNRPERKNPLTFESYDELRNLFRTFANETELKSVIITGAGGNFCSGGDVHEIIGPLTSMEMTELWEFTRMTGDLVAAMMECPQVVIAAIDGICAGAGACMAMASDLRLGTERSKVAFLFVRVGLAGCDMGACNILPRIIGQGRAAELLYTGRSMAGEEALRVGFYSRLVASESLSDEALRLAQSLASGPTLAHTMTKSMLQREWSMSPREALEAEAEAQAQCMRSNDFKRAYEAFKRKEKPVFEGD